MLNDSLVVLSVGDVMVARDAPSTIFDPCRDVLGTADVLLGNLEGPITEGGSPVPGKLELGSVLVSARVNSAAALAEAGFTAVTLANNHMMDFGPAGLQQTIDLLDENGIVYSGAGPDIAAARRPAVIKAGDGTRIAMLGYTTVFPLLGYVAGPQTPGVSTVRVDTAYRTPPNVPYQPGTPAITVTIPDPEDTRRMVADIEAASKSADIVIVQMHWGVAVYPHVIGYMKELGRGAIDAGADLVIGNHPHLLLGFEYYRDRLIAYSLNHFAFDLPLNWPGAYDAVVLKSVLREGRLRHSLLPVDVDPVSRTPDFARGARHGEVAVSLEELCRTTGTTLRRDGEELVIEPNPDVPPVLRTPEVFSECHSMLWHGGARVVVGLD